MKTGFTSEIAARVNQRTPFVGRNQEVDDITRCIIQPDCRLLTICGPGGIGKTRLAIKAAQSLADQFTHQFTHGVYFIDLHALQSGKSLPTALLESLDLPPPTAASPLEYVTSALSEYSLLLVLDNFEHILDGVDTVASLLLHLPRLKILTTSRVALNLQEEWLYPISGLAFPSLPNNELPVTPLSSPPAPFDYPAIALFDLCARRAYPAFVLDAELDHVLRICRLVEGMPLALELAAAWTRTLSCGQIADDIERSCDLLATTMHNTPERHRSIHAIFDQTWTQLSPSEQATYMRLSVFPGSFSRAAAQEIAGATPPILARLVDHSLVRLVANNRYTTHSLLRQLGYERLAKDTNARTATQFAYMSFYSALLQRLYPDIMGQDQLGATAEITEELENIRIACDWALLHGAPQEIGQFTPTLGYYYNMTSRYLEGAVLFDRAVERLENEETRQDSGSLSTNAEHLHLEDTKLLIHCLLDKSFLHIRLGHLDTASAAVEQAEILYRKIGEPAIFGDGTDPDIPRAIIAQVRGEYEIARSAGEQAYTRSLAQDNLFNHSICCNIVARNAMQDGDIARAQDYAQRGLRSTEKTGNRWFRSYLLNSLGEIAYAREQLNISEQYFLESYRIRRDYDDNEGMALALGYLGEIALRRKEYDRANTLFTDALNAYKPIHDKGGLAYAHLGLAKVALASNTLELARQNLLAGFAAAREVGSPPTILGLINAAGSYFAQLEQLDTAAELFHVAIYHPATRPVIKRRAQNNLENIQPKLDSARDFSNVSFDLDALSSHLSITLTHPPETYVSVSLDTGQPEQAENTAAANDRLVEPLTSRELEVLSLIHSGLSNAQIAERLILSLGTVKFYTAQIYGKLNVGNRLQAVNLARSLGLLNG